METQTIQINGSNLDKARLLQLIKGGRKLEAVKYVKATTRLSSRQSEDIVDNLAENPNYYSNDIVDIKQNSGNRIKIGDNQVKATQPTKTGGHVIEQGSSLSRSIIIIVVAAIVTVLVWLLIR